MTTLSDTIRSTIAVGGYEMFVPTFTDEAQAERFAALRLVVTAEHETHNGVSWIGTLTDGSDVINIEQDGNGGCNFYSGPRTGVESFAQAIFPGQYEALDMLFTAVDIWTAVA